MVLRCPGGSRGFSAFSLNLIFKKHPPHPENPDCHLPLWKMPVPGRPAAARGESCPSGLPSSVFLPTGFNKLSVADPSYIAGLLHVERTEDRAPRWEGWVVTAFITQVSHLPSAFGSSQLPDPSPSSLSRDHRMEAFSQGTFFKITRK